VTRIQKNNKCIYKCSYNIYRRQGIRNQNRSYCNANEIFKTQRLKLVNNHFMHPRIQYSVCKLSDMMLWPDFYGGTVIYGHDTISML